MISNSSNVDYKNISLFLGSDFHHVIYPVSSEKDLNFIAIMKYNLSKEEQKNYKLFSDDNFIKKILEKVPKENVNLLVKLRSLKIFPVFVSDDFFKNK